MSYKVVYYSGSTGMTERFVNRLGIDSERIPVAKKDGNIEVSEKFILIVPTYGAGTNDPESKKNAVHRQIVAFLNVDTNRENCIGIIGAGNKNFLEHYILGAKMVAGKLGVPLIGQFELFGTVEEVDEIREIISAQWDALVAGEIESNVVTKK